jgi:putative hydrolases of HD superfamily
VDEDVEEAMDNDSATGVVGFAHEAGHLKHIRRAGWLLAGVRDGESVAEHSFRVGVLAYCIAVQEGANPDRAATLGLFHDLPETRIGDIHSVGKAYVQTADPRRVVADQVAELPAELAGRIGALIAEHESAKTPEATLESKCSRDADKIECLLQAREYECEGYKQLDHWVTSMAEAVTTATGKRLAAAALEVSPGAWWDDFARTYGQPRG